MHVKRSSLSSIRLMRDWESIWERTLGWLINISRKLKHLKHALLTQLLLSGYLSNMLVGTSGSLKTISRSKRGRGTGWSVRGWSPSKISLLRSSGRCFGILFDVCTLVYYIPHKFCLICCQVFIFFGRLVLRMVILVSIIWCTMKRMGSCTEYSTTSI